MTEKNGEKGGAEKRLDALVTASRDKQIWWAMKLDKNMMPQPENLAQIRFFCELIISANMAPKSYTSANQVMLAWMYANRLGFDLWTALETIAVIDNKPTVYGHGVLALVRRSGLLESFEERIEGSGDMMTAVVKVRRKGDNSVYQREYSMEDAKIAGLTSKDNWRHHPKDMLLHKAKARVLKAAFGDILHGIHYHEDLIDEIEQEPVVVSREEKSPFDEMPPPEPSKKETVEEVKPPQQEQEEESVPEEGQGDQEGQEDQEGQGDQEGQPDMIPRAPLHPSTKTFEELLKAEKPDELQRLAVDKVLQEVAQFHDVTIKEVKRSAEQQWPKFWENVTGYIKSNRKTLHLPSTSLEAKGDTANDNFWQNRDNWFRSRGRGFKRLVDKNLEALKGMPIEFIVKEVLAKWLRISEDLGDFPLMAEVIKYCKENNIDPKQYLPKTAFGQTKEPPVAVGAAEGIYKPKEAPIRDHIPETLLGLRSAIDNELNFDEQLVNKVSEEIEIPLTSMDIEQCRELLMNIYVVYGVDVESLNRF